MAPAIQGFVEGLFGKNRWSLNWVTIMGALLIPLVLVSVGDRLMRRR